MISNKMLVLVTILFFFVQSVTPQTLTATPSPVSQSITESHSSSNSNSNSNSNSYSNSHSNSYSITVSVTSSYSYSITFTPSYTLSGTFSVAFGYPQIQGITNTNPNDLFNLNIAWQPPVGFNYQSYQLTLITNGTSITYNDIPTTSFLLTPANSNGLIQPGGIYVVQVRGFVNGAFGPVSLPFNTGTFGGDPYGPTGFEPSVVNNLKCNYLPQNLRCTWITGSRTWINATFDVNCTRIVDPIRSSQAHIYQKVPNIGGSTNLPTISVVPLPSGCICSLKFTVFYSTSESVTLLLPGNGGFIITNKSPQFLNTPIVVGA